MTDAVHVLWWVSLALALVATLVAASFLADVVRLCSQIAELARRTVPAAQGIARNTAALSSTKAVIGLAPALLSAATAIDGHADTIGSTLESVAPKRG